MHDSGKKAGGDVASAAGAAVGMGGAATAAAVTACCAGPAVGPLVISLVGAGTAVSLENLRPYGFLMLALSGAAIGLSFWLNVKPRPKASCANERAPLVSTIARVITWLSGIAWVTAAVLMVWSRLAQ